MRSYANCMKATDAAGCVRHTFLAPNRYALAYWCVQAQARSTCKGARPKLSPEPAVAKQTNAPTCGASGHSKGRWAWLAAHAHTAGSQKTRHFRWHKPMSKPHGAACKAL